ncbi:MAG: hypothetical protein AXA67_05495 [Methylothermaceae bacteria B42]|nr:MAG: hypothetical protein AXA67_05495 [Methylothermaceae bacteria B42]HHJ40306.1 hypothetical protein [Methylothermaceae bacterium]
MKRPETANLNLEQQLHHQRNTRILECVLTLPVLSISSNAQEKIKALERVLAAYRDDPNKLLTTWKGK